MRCLKRFVTLEDQSDVDQGESLAARVPPAAPFC